MSGDEDESIRRFGLPPRPEAMAEIRRLLREETAREAARQGDGDTLRMRALCAQLFAHGEVGDALLVWTAKRASFDATFSIEIHLLCGAGVEATRRWLAGHPDPAAQAALERLEVCVTAGDFEGFSPSAYFKVLSEYYA